MTIPKGKRDIMGEVLTGTEESSFPAVEELTDLFQSKKRDRGRVRAQRLEPPPPPRGKNKKKATLYLSDETHEGLSSSLVHIKELVPEPLRRQISKSHLVDVGMRFLLQEFEDKGPKSLLMKQFPLRGEKN